MDNDEAPDPLPSCQYGDYGRTIYVNGAWLTCGQWLDSAQGGSPESCYYDSNYETCCETCDNIRSSDPGNSNFNQKHALTAKCIMLI